MRINKTYKNKFRLFSGQYIPDIITYLRKCIENDPNVTISVGCDSIQKRYRTVYAVTIMIYNNDLQKGAHVVFFRESHMKIKNNMNRLYNEVLYLYEVATFLDEELSKFYKRKDLTEFERKKYKYHLYKCDQKYDYVKPNMEENIIKSLILNDTDNVNFKLVDIHADFNTNKNRKSKKGISENKSFYAYKNYVPWLRGLGFRTWVKPIAYAATSAADILLNNQ